MYAQPESRRSLPALALFLGLGAGACYPSAGTVSGPSSGGGSRSGAGMVTGVEGIVYLTQDKSSENVPVFMIWMEEGGEALEGGGIESEKLAVPVAEGELPRGARVAQARTDAAGHFEHAQETPGGVTLRIGTLPENCRPPRDQVVEIEAGVVKQVQIDVLCYGPKPPPLE